MKKGKSLSKSKSQLERTWIEHLMYLRGIGKYKSGHDNMNVKRLKHVMYVCIILHNMILEDEGIARCQYDENEVLPNIEGVVVGTQEY